MKEKQKYYFNSIDETVCYDLDTQIDIAKSDGLDKITLIEAIPDKDSFYVWCTLKCEPVDRDDCRKSECNAYEPNKSGRGVCFNRGKIFTYGKEVTFNIV